MIKFNVIIYNINKNKFVSYDIIPYLKNSYQELEHKPTTFDEFKKFILSKSIYQWWGRCEYEIILSDWPCEKHEEKWDVYKQIEMNIDLITSLFIKEIKNL
jgi:hypothetical protein